MPRTPRTFCDSKVYHIIIKGIDNQDIFYDNEDRFVFLDDISKSQKKYPYNVYAYCLMNNHIHMVIKVDDELLSKAIQSLTIRYAYYFNKKYDREGTFVRNRFKSKKIENEQYFLEVCRYVHRNPEKANIEKTDKYRWSSYKDYVNANKKSFTCTDVLMYYFDYNIQSFINFTLKKENLNEINRFADFELIQKLTDEQLMDIIIKKYDINETEGIIKYFKKSSSIEYLHMIKEISNIVGTNPRQISRVLGINRNKIYKIYGDKKNRYQCHSQKKVTKRTGTNVPMSQISPKRRKTCHFLNKLKRN